MTGITSRYGTYEVDHTKFGGIICLSDFNTDYRGKDNIYGSPIANRIAKDNQLDNQWRKNKKYIDNNIKKGTKKNA